MVKIVAQELVLARDLMSRPVYRLTPATPVRDAAAFLLRHGISGAPVVGLQGRPVGVFSLTDVGRAVQRVLLPPAARERTLEGREAPAPGAPTTLEGLEKATVASLMTPGLFTVFPEATLAEVSRTMSSQKIHRVFVISEEGELEGIITTMDILRWMNQRQSRERVDLLKEHSS